MKLFEIRIILFRNIRILALLGLVWLYSIHGLNAEVKVADKGRPTPSAIVILAAGQGTRMNSDLPKVLHEVAGKPMIYRILSQVHRAVPDAAIAVLVGNKKELLIKYLKNEPAMRDIPVTFVVQEMQKGTGHATRAAIESGWGQARIREGSAVLILPGDLPLMPERLIAEVARPLQEGVALRLLTCKLDHPRGYGRILRNESTHEVLRIVEEKDADAKQKQIKEVGLSIYLFNSRFLSESLKLLNTNNAQGEYYLTDLIEIAQKQKKKIDVLVWPEQNDLINVNTPAELVKVNKIMEARETSAFMEKRKNSK